MKDKKTSDKEYVKLLKAGDKEAFEKILEKYTEKVFHLSMRITRNQQDAEDVLQDVFTTIFAKINSFQERSAFSSWLFRITVNTAYMKLRTRKKHTTINIADINLSDQNSWAGKRSDTNDITFMTIRSELKNKLTDAIKTLPEDYQTIFILRDVDGLSNKDVSDVLSISVPAVKSRLHRARLSLRKQLNNFYCDYITDDLVETNSQVAC
jgi:RNA polymerase sigma-70 factor (ECF subfamily)